MYTHVPVFSSTQGAAVSIDDNSDKDRNDQRTELSSDTTEWESKVHALWEEGVEPSGHPTSQVWFQNMQEFIHLQAK